MDSKKVSSFEKHSIKNFQERLFKYPDQYEYVLCFGYEERIEMHNMEAVQIGDVFASLLLRGEHYELVSLYFDIALHPLQIQKWTQKYQVELHDPSETILLKNALKVVAALKFNGRIIALFEKGNKDISISSNDLIEITESYKRFEQISNTSLSNPVEDEDLMI